MNEGYINGDIYERLKSMDSEESCEFGSYLTELIDSGALEGAADKVKGITLRVIDQG